MSQPCFLCEKLPQESPDSTKQCLLCNRPFCATHKGHFENTCEVNHSSYYHDHPNLPNVFPSLGERERALMTIQSPTTQDAEHPDRMTLATSPIVAGGDDSGKGADAHKVEYVPISEKDAIDADEAV